MSLLSVSSYLTAFWSTAVIGCVTVPENWEYWLPVHKWLFPAVHDYIEARKPYASEKQILQSLEQSNELERLDGFKAHD